METYGRGIWDFEVENITTSNRDAKELDFRCYPNPSSNFLTIDGIESGRVNILNLQGQKLSSHAMKGITTLDISSLSSGTYFIHYQGITKQFIKL